MSGKINNLSSPTAGPLSGIDSVKTHLTHLRRRISIRQISPLPEEASLATEGNPDTQMHRTFPAYQNLSDNLLKILLFAIKLFPAASLSSTDVHCQLPLVLTSRKERKTITDVRSASRDSANLRRSLLTLTFLLFCVFSFRRGFVLFALMDVILARPMDKETDASHFDGDGEFG